MAAGDVRSRNLARVEGDGALTLSAAAAFNLAGTANVVITVYRGTLRVGQQGATTATAGYKLVNGMDGHNNSPGTLILPTVVVANMDVFVQGAEICYFDILGIYTA
jgi:hypothetical protein